MTTVLSSLKVIARPEITPKPPVLGKRMKLLDKLEQQLSLAECMIEGREFEAYKERSVKDPETGERKKVRRSYTVRPWFYDNDGHYYLEIRICNKAVELQKGCAAIDVGERSNLPAVIKLVIEAVEKGELDAQLLAPVPTSSKQGNGDIKATKSTAEKPTGKPSK
ncbi:DUF6641 family protein [Shewanella algae]|uniref:DUF6641 family protein n=1 Tax=Shewanella algae TaxID=38313 RepID=UPI0031F56F79